MAISLCYGVTRALVLDRDMVLAPVAVLARVMVLACDGWGCESHGLSTQRMMSSRPKWLPARSRVCVGGGVYGRLSSILLQNELLTCSCILLTYIR